MKIHSRVVNVITFILVFSMISAPSLDGSNRGLSVAQGIPPSPYPVTVTLSTGEKVFIAAHTSNLQSGNWIELSSGSTITLPSIVLSYEGPDSASYTRDGITITIDSLFAEGGATYPLETHRVYSTDQSISAKFWGATALGDGQVDFKLIKLSSLSETREMAVEAFRGNLAPIQDKLGDPTWSKTSVTLDSSGDASVTIPKKSVGTYILLVVKETSSPYELYVYSATIIEVVDQTLAVSCPSSVKKGDTLNINTGVTGLYINGAVLIKKSAYQGEIKLVSDGSVLSTELYLNDVLMADGEFIIDTEDFSYEDAITLLNRLKTVFGNNQIAIGVNPITGTISLSTSHLTTGDYILLVGVYDPIDSKIVGVYQKTVTVQAPTGPGPVIVPPTPPTAEQIMAMTDQDAAAAIAGLTPDQAATLMAQISTQKAAAIMNLVPAKTAAQILAKTTKSVALSIIKEMNTSAVAAMLKEAVSLGYTTFFSEILNELDPEQAAEILLETDSVTGARLVEGMALNNLNAAALRVEAAVKKRLGESDPAKAQEMLDKIAETLENADTGALVDIFIEIANLPATPSTVATVLEAMSLTKTLDVVTAWIDTGSLNELAEVYSYFTDDFLDTVWMAMSSTQRNALYPYLDSATKVRLPQMGEFQVSELSVTPATVQVGAVVTVSAKVTNMGADTATYTAVLKIDGSTEATKSVTLSPGQSTTVTWTVSRATAGTYSVAVDTQTGSFTVTAPPQPAAFAYSNLQVSPTSVQTGEAITVSVIVTNTGDLSGTADVELKVDGVIVETKSVTLDPKTSSTATFTVTKATAGTYTVSVGSLTGSFTVTAPAPPTQPTLPWEIIIIVGVIVAAIACYLYSQRKSGISPTLSS